MPTPEIRNSELGVWGLALGTWDKNLIFTFLIDIFVQSQISSPEFRVPGFGTRYKALGVRGSALGTRDKNLIYTFLIDIFVQSQISSPESQVLSPDFQVPSSEF